MTQYVKEKVAKIEQPVTAWILIGVIGALACAYAFFVSMAIANAVSAKEVSAKTAVLTTTVGDLEAEYLAAKSSVDLAYARTLGFEESKSGTIYIAKKGPSLSINK
jgi:hypothetical protein